MLTDNIAQFKALCLLSGKLELVEESARHGQDVPLLYHNVTSVICGKGVLFFWVGLAPLPAAVAVTDQFSQKLESGQLVPCAARPSHSSDDALSFSLHLADPSEHSVDEPTAQPPVSVQSPKFLHDDGDIDEYFVQYLQLALSEDGGIGICV